MMSPYLALMESLSLDLPLLLQTVHNILVAPANLVRQTLEYVTLESLQANRCSAYLDCAVLPPRLQSENPESLRHNHTLLPVVGRRNTLKELEAVKSCRTASRLVGDHTADGPVENLGGSAVVEGTRLFGVHNMTLVKEVVVPQL